MVRLPQERRSASRHWQPGSLGPYGPPPARPASLPIEKPPQPTPWLETLEGGAQATGSLILFLFVVGASLLLPHFLGSAGWTTADPIALPAGSMPSAPTPHPLPSVVRKQLESIRRTDPDFSVVLLEDFLYALYTEAQTARGQGATARLSPYLALGARVDLDALGARPVSGVVVGALRFVSFSPGPVLKLAVEIEANYAEEHDAQPQGYYTRETWRLERKAEARSRAPAAVRVLGCPSCAAPLDRVLGGTCAYCNRVVDNGDFDWVVTGIQMHDRTPRGPMLTGTVAEAGTYLGTIFDPDLEQALGRLHAQDPAFDEQTLRARVEHIFQVMQTAWSTLRWEQARPYLSDNLFEAQTYWMAAYLAQGLRNITENTRVTGVELARLTQDRWYDAVTVRVRAIGLDYTIRDRDGQVVGGSKTEARAYTEYWTLIRGTGHTGPTRADDACPSCGAPLVLGMAGRCSHCQAKVNSGEFDWVLSRIEQDEVYTG